MKKSLIALAVFGAFSGAALADGNNVQLYGLIDLGVTHYTGISNGAGGTTSSTGLSSGVQSGSRIGLKGTEDLGGGVNALFDVETGFCAAGLSQDKGVATPASGLQTYCTGGGFMQRQSWIGLQGNFGTVMGGRMYTNAFNNEANMDPFGYGLNGNIGTLALGAPRADQTLVYITPNLSGFTGNIAYVFSADNGTVPTAANPNVPRAVSLDGQYANGPITAGLSYTQVSNVVPNTAGTAIDGNQKLWQLFGAYDFGVAKISGIYEKQTSDNSTASPDQKFYMLGATVPVGPGAILVSYNHLDNGKPDGIAKQYGIGYTYSLSKQTNLYASYAHLTNGNATTKAVGSSTDGFTGVAGQSSSGMAVGIRHMF
ncbi:MAG: porin [Betaproteobacteria bacterium]|nr:porin [Betaproteobacteria bacterium]